MALILLYPPGPLYAHYRGVEEALDYARTLHERQRALAATHPDFYDADVHATVLAFNLRIISRKLDTFASAFRACIRPGQIGGVSRRTAGLQQALQHYNAAVAVRDAWDNAVDATVNVLDLAFDCLSSLEEDIWLFEQRN